MKFIRISLLFSFLTACVPVTAAQEAPAAAAPAGQGQGVSSRRELPREISQAYNGIRPYTLRGLSSTERQHAGKPGLRATGVRRYVPAAALTHATRTIMRDGRLLWQLALRSPDAAGTRIHFRNFDAGTGEIWVYSPADSQAGRKVLGPYSGRGPNGDGEFWSATVASDTVIVACVLPSGDGGPPFEIDAISHRWTDPDAGPPRTVVLQTDPAAAFFDPAAPCNLDVSCYSAYQSIAKAVVQFDFVSDDGGSYLCSGSLINTRNSSFKPYLLTAHHCIGSDSEARTIEAHFFYQTSSCNSPPPDISSVPTILGGRYLAAAPIGQGDFSFLLLNGVPGGVFFAGWNTALDLGASAHGIHHPKGSFKRISFGTRGPDQTFNIEGEIAPASLYYQVPWTTGLTEPGSSGSPLLNDAGQILGTLTAGPIVPPGLTACDIVRQSTYGRFGNAYAVISPYLEDAAPPSLTVTPTSLAFQVLNGIVSGAPQQSLLVRTQSTAAIGFTLTASAQWIHAAATGTASAAAPATVPVSIDPSVFASSGTYSGALSLASGTLTPVSVSVTVTATIQQSVVTPSINPNPVYQHTTADADGYSWFYTLKLAESAGVGTRLTSFKIDGFDYTSSIPAFFGTDTLAAFGSISASLRTKGLTVPVTRLFEYTGTDLPSGRTWSRQLRVQFNGVFPQAILQLQARPDQVRQNPNAGPNCQWIHVLTLQETNGFPVQLTRFIAGGNDLSDKVAAFFGSSRLDANGSLDAGVCWSGINVPTVLNFEVDGTDSNGNTVTATSSASFLGPLPTAAPASVNPGSVLLTAPGGSSTSVSTAVSLNFGGSAPQWSLSMSPSGQNTRWLSVFPLSGSGSTQIFVSANPTGLANGSYQVTLNVEAVNAAPQVISIPVTLRVGALAGPAVNPIGLANGASFQRVFAPGMIMSIFGAQLATSVDVASRVPLPLSLAGSSVKMNGVSAPFYFASPGQLNVQVPYELAPGPATVTVTVNGQSSSQPFTVTSSALGIFTLDGRKIVPFATGRRGQILTLFITGEGYVIPPVATGNAPPASATLSQLPRPLLPINLSVGGITAALQFVGIPYGLVGVTQVNYQVPPNTPLGDQPVVVTSASGQSSPPAFLTITP